MNKPSEPSPEDASRVPSQDAAPGPLSEDGRAPESDTGPGEGDRERRGVNPARMEVRVRRSPGHP